MGSVSKETPPLMNMSISLNSEDGFISQECPDCKGIFKIEQVKGSSNKLSHCPYCQRQGQDDWWTQAQADYISATLAKKLVEGPMDEAFSRLGRNSGGLVTVKKTGSVRVPPAPPEPEQGWPIVTFSCCNERLRLDPEQKATCCPICGKASE